MAWGNHECEVSRADVQRAADDVRFDLQRRIEDLDRELTQTKNDLRKLSSLVGRLASKVSVEEEW